MNIIMLERDQLAVGGSAEAHALLRARTMTDCLEHHFAADDELDRLAELPRCRRSQRAVRPWPQLTAKARAQEFGNHANALLRQAEHLREYAAQVKHSLRCLVKRQRR